MQIICIYAMAESKPAMGAGRIGDYTMNTLDFLARVRPGEAPYDGNSDVRVHYDSSVFHYRQNGDVTQALYDVAAGFDSDQIGATVDVSISSAQHYYEIPVGPADYGDLSAVDICLKNANRVAEVANEAGDVRQNLSDIEVAVFFAAHHRSECERFFDAVIDEFEDRGEPAEIAGDALNLAKIQERRIQQALGRARRLAA